MSGDVEKLQWFGLTRLREGGVEGNVESYDFFNVWNGGWWSHFGDATKFATVEATFAAACEWGFCDRTDYKTFGITTVWLRGHGVRTFVEVRGETSTLGEDLDAGEWWKG